MTNNRIEYIDALRGFVMVLVVLAHVPMYCYHDVEGLSFSLIPTTFHLALFFFISGWFAGDGLWFKVYGLRFTVYGLRFKVYGLRFTVYGLGGVRKKFMQLIVPTAVFYLLYCWLNGLDIVDNLWNDKYKAGYWFCIVLFCFYLTITLTKTITRKTGSLGGVVIGAALSVVFMMFNTNAMTNWLGSHHIPNILCLQQWQYFVFFWMGSMANRYKERFFALLDNGRVMAVGILLFFGSLLAFYHQPAGLVGIKTEFLLWGGLGAVLSFAFFRKYEKSFSRGTYVGRGLQYIGRRTLDVYLLHFFFLPTGMEWVGDLVMGNGNPAIELFVSLLIALMVIALCLLTSNIVRLSPVLAHWLLGVRR